MDRASATICAGSSGQLSRPATRSAPITEWPDMPRVPAGLPYANRAVDVARQQGMLGLLPLALRRQAMELLWNSQLDQAYAAAQEGYRLSLEVGYGSGEHLANIASLEAVRGRTEEARRHAAEAHAIGQRRGSAFLVSAAEFTLGFIELTAGRAAEAADRLFAVTAFERSDISPIIALSAIPDAVEAGVRAGRHQEAADRLAVFRAWVAQAPSPPRRALLARCEALLGERPPLEAFAEAIEHGAALAPFQRARTELLFGEWLRRERRRQEARTHLRAAPELFRGLGSPTVPARGRKAGTSSPEPRIISGEFNHGVRPAAEERRPGRGLHHRRALRELQ